MINFSWGGIDTYITRLENQIKTSNIPVTMVVGVARGGLIPAIMLSHRLGVEFDMICWQTRDGSFRDIEKVCNLNKGTLIVDDICDSGRTITEIKEMNPNLMYAVIVDKLEDSIVDFYGCSMYTEEWIHFPWERDVEQKTNYIGAINE